MNFVAIILVLWSFFMRFFAWPIFRLTLLTFRPQTGSAQRALSDLRVSQLCFSSNCFGDLFLYLWCEGLKRGWRHPHCWPPPLLPPPPTALLRPFPLLPPPFPSAPWWTHPTEATFEWPLAKNTQFYTNFHIFFKLSENLLFLSSFSPRCHVPS